MLKRVILIVFICLFVILLTVVSAACHTGTRTTLTSISTSNTETTSTTIHNALVYCT